MRMINDDGTWGAKQRKKYLFDDKGNKIYDPKKRQYKCSKIETTDWNNPSKADEWRKAWEDMCNAELKRLGHDVRIDRRTYAEQGIEKVPTVHVGASSAQMEIKGFRTERGDINREIAVSNKDLRQINARLKKLKSWLYSQPFDKIDKAPSMSDVLQNIKITEQFRSNARKIADLQAFANVVNFLRVGNLSSIDELADKVTNMQQSQYDLAGEIKKQDRRLATLDLHLHNVEIYNSHKSIYQEYLALPKNKRETFKSKNSASISAHDTAHKYLSRVLNGRTSVPAKAWKVEREKLMSERHGLCDKYYSLKDDVKNVEALRRGAEKAMGEITFVKSKDRKPDISR
jgi:ATP-dependent exoDNAse (exonuclease V) alpha subunit